MAHPHTFAVGLSPSPIATFPKAPLLSRTVGFPESGSDLGVGGLDGGSEEELRFVEHCPSVQRPAKSA